jgi:hypothetical protein
MSLGLLARRALAAALLLLALGPEVQQAAAGTVSATFQVKATLVDRSSDGCRGAGDPVTLTCGPPRAPTVLQPRPELTGITLADGWLTYGSRTEVSDSVYAASLTTRVIRYREWEYIETLVSW